jgi:uncharacterized protein (DUF427 family)
MVDSFMKSEVLKVIFGGVLVHHSSNAVVLFEAELIMVVFGLSRD